MIERIYVKNFRCFSEFELKLDGRRSTLLIGKNGVGKSTIARVLELLQLIARGTNRVGQLVKPSDMRMSHPAPPTEFELCVNLDSVRYAYLLSLVLPAGASEFEVAQEHLLAGGEIIYERSLRLSPEDAEWRTGKEFGMAPNFIALPVVPERSDHDPLTRFKRWLAGALILDPIPKLMSGNSGQEASVPVRTVENYGEWFSGLIRSTPAAYAKVEEFLKSVIPDLWDVQNPLIGSESHSIQVQFRAEAGSLKVPFADLSDGEKCFFVAALAIAANEAREPVFCFWDEPDNYLSLDEVGYLTSRLRQSFEQQGQLVVTSHNPEAVRRFSRENTLVMFRENHLSSPQVRQVRDLDVGGDLVGAMIRGDVEP